MLEIGWKTKKVPEFIFDSGENWKVGNDLFIMLEEFVCQLYSY